MNQPINTNITNLKPSAELGYPATDQLKFVLGANNILNKYPNMIATRASQGMPFPRRTPIGYHGGMVYFKAIYKLD